MIRAYASVAAVAAVTVLVGCAGAPVPQGRVNSSGAAIRAAQEVGAQNEPQAALHLRLAEEQRAQGLQLIDKGDNERADLMLERAQSDAEVAVVLAREAQTREQANRTLEEVRALRSKL